MTAPVPDGGYGNETKEKHIYKMKDEFSTKQARSKIMANNIIKGTSNFCYLESLECFRDGIRIFDQ